MLICLECARDAALSGIARDVLMDFCIVGRRTFHFKRKDCYFLGAQAGKIS